MSASSPALEPPRPAWGEPAYEESRILIVDDEPSNVELLRRMLWRWGYRFVESTTDSRGAVDLVARLAPDLLVLDLHMPHRSGFDVMEELRRREGGEVRLPILVLTADATVDTMARALAGGATDFLTKPFDPVETRLRIRNLLERRSLHKTLAEHNDRLELEIRARTVDLASTIAKLETAVERLHDSYLDTARRLALAAESRDDETAFHIERVAHYAFVIARHIGLGEEEADVIRLASPLHDVGKIGIQDTVLFNPGRLDDAQMREMQRHPEIGRRMLDGSSSPLLQTATQIAWTHHERWDGGGYPRGLRGEGIPVAGRIASVADAFDAMTSRRRYKPALSLHEAFEEVHRNRAKQFDPLVVDVFCAAETRIVAIARRFRD